jgi:hypothetical protein
MNKKVLFILTLCLILLLSASSCSFYNEDKPLEDMIHFSLNKMIIKEPAFYLDSGKEDMQRQNYFNMNPIQIDDLFKNKNNYSLATFEIVTTNNFYNEVVVCEINAIGKLPIGVWLQKDLTPFYMQVDKGEGSSGLLEFLFDKNIAKKEDIEKFVKDGGIGVNIRSNAVTVIVPINKNTATFAF